MSLSKVVTEKRKEIDKLVKSLPAFKKECNELEKQILSLNGMHNFYEKKETEEKLKQLQSKIIDIESGNIRKTFEAHIQPYLIAEKKRKEIPISKKIKKDTSSTISNRRKRKTSESVRVTEKSEKSLLDDYNCYYNLGGCAIYMSAITNCENCGGELQKLPHEALLACVECGVSCSFVDASSASLGYSDEVEYSTFSYRRINHFVDWISGFQARENAEIPEIVMENIMKKLFARRVKVEDIEPNLIRQILKELTKTHKSYRKYYENTMLISCKLTGKSPPRLTPTQENQLKKMFLAIQSPFLKHCPSDRKNFLSYSYCLYKFCELLGLPYLQYFSLLKGKEKLSKMDQIWRLICAELNWEYIPST